MADLLPISRHPSYIAPTGTPPTGGDDMERIAALEANMHHVQTDVTEIRGDMKDVLQRMTAVEVTMKSLPSKAFMFMTFGTITVGALAFLTAVIAFQDAIQAWVGVTT